MEMVRILVDAVIIFILLEFVLLRLLSGRAGQGIKLASIGFHLASGLALLCALRAALADLPNPWWIAFFLAAAGLLHGLDMRRHWRR